MRVVITFSIFLLFANISFAQTRIFIPEPFGDNFIESELITEVSCVPLSLERYGMVSQDMEMKVDGENYFILDNKNTRCVYRFNKEGELLNKITNVKESTANGETVLNNPVKFSVDNYKKQIGIYSFESASIDRFKYDGSKIDQIMLDYSPSDFIRDSKGNYWLYTGWNSMETQYRLIKADATGNTLQRKMRLITKCTPTEGFAFSNFGEQTFMWEGLGNLIYSVKDDKNKPLYRFDYGPKSLPLDYHMQPAEESFRTIHGIGYYTIKKYLANDNYSYFFLNYSSVEQREMFHIIHDKKADQIYIYTENAAIGAFNKAQALTNDNELVFLVSPLKMRQLLGSGVDFVPAAFEGLTDEIRKLRNPMILKLKLGEMVYDYEEALPDENLEYGN